MPVNSQNTKQIELARAITRHVRDLYQAVGLMKFGVPDYITIEIADKVVPLIEKYEQDSHK